MFGFSKGGIVGKDRSQVNLEGMILISKSEHEKSGLATVLPYMNIKDTVKIVNDDELKKIKIYNKAFKLMAKDATA